MTILADARSALEQAIVGVTGFPSSSNRAWENVSFSPVTGTPWARMTFIPTSRKPATIGNNPIYKNTGILVVNAYFPEGDGPNAADALADNILSAFNVDTLLTVNTTNVRIQFAERRQGVENSPWYMVPVIIYWFAYHT